MKAKWHIGRVTDIEHISKTKLSFSIKLKEEQQFEFEAGQFVTMDLPLGEKRRQRWRSYSIANIPNVENKLSFSIGYLENGLASAYFFEQMSIGDEIKFKGPEGTFVLPANLNRPIIMIATGTGVVPFISMLRKIKQDKIPFESIHLIYGSRLVEDILYHSELEEWKEEFGNFQFDIVLSRATNWNGTKGYVHDTYLNSDIHDEEQVLYLLCGWTSMIDEAMLNLFPKVNDPTKQIKYELYG